MRKRAILIPLVMVFAPMAHANLQWVGTNKGLLINLTYGSTTRDVWCGQLRMKNLITNQTIWTMCDDIVSFLDNPGDSWNCTQVSTGSLTADLVAAGHMVANVPGAFNPVTSSDDLAAAMNLAIWESTFDFAANAGTANFAGGSFKANNASVAVLGLANSIYNTYVNGSGNAIQYTAGTNITGTHSQNQIAPVPEPASLAVLALGAIAVVRRRRSN